jgi:hypothetical protein
MIDDMDLRLDWGSTNQYLKVYHKNTLVYNSEISFFSPVLEPRQVKWITEHYEQKRKKYVF